MELRHLRYFVAVAQELSFTRAAQRLGISQPPLGQQVRDLERELGVLLLERTKRRVALTEAGRLFLEGAERTLQQAAAAAELARRAGRGEAGTLAIGFISSASYEVLPRVLRAYRRHRPEVALRLEQMTTSGQVEALSEGAVHVGLLGERTPQGWLEQAVLAREPLLAAVPAGHPRARRGQVRLRHLAGEPFVIHPRRAAPGNYDRIVGLCHRAGFSPRIEHEADEMQTRVGLVAAGLGVALLPASARHVRIDGAAFLRLEDEVEPLEIVAAWRRDDRSPLLRAFAEVVRQEARAAGAG